MALAFISVFGGLLWHSSKPGVEQFPVPPGQLYSVAIYACAFTCGRSFTVHTMFWAS